MEKGDKRKGGESFHDFNNLLGYVNVGMARTYRRKEQACLQIPNGQDYGKHASNNYKIC